MKIVWGMLEPLEEYRKIAAKFNEEMVALTNGEVEIEVKLFDKDPSDPLKEIEDGNLDIYQIPSTQLRQLTNQDWLKVWEVPFLFKSDAHVEAYIECESTKEKLMSLETEKLLPLTYSYAGGFCAVVSKRYKEKYRSYENLNSIEFSEHEYEDMDMDKFLVDIYQHLPSNILMYEINEMLKLRPKIKSLINIDLTKHLVVARVTMLSKDAISKIPFEFRNAFVTSLNKLLREERQVIYARSEANAIALKEDGHIGVDEDLNKEISLINSL